MLNLGVGGYDTLNEVAVLEETGLAFSPDLVVLAYCINDAGVHSANAHTIRWVDRFGWLLRISRLALFITQRGESYWLRNEFERANRDDVFRREFSDRMSRIDVDDPVRELIENLRAEMERAPAAEEAPYLRWYLSTPKLARLRYSFERLGKTAGAHSFDVLVLLIPYLDEGKNGELRSPYRKVYEIVAHEAKRVGFRVLSLHDAFVEYELERLRRKGPIHPNAAGHQLIARELARAGS